MHCTGNGVVTADVRRKGLFRRAYIEVVCQKCGHIWEFDRADPDVRTFVAVATIFGHDGDALAYALMPRCGNVPQGG